MAILTKEEFEKHSFTHYLRTGERRFYSDYLKWAMGCEERLKPETKELEALVTQLLSTKLANAKYCTWRGGECTKCKVNNGRIFETATVPIPMHNNCKCACEAINVAAKCAWVTRGYNETPTTHPVHGTQKPHLGVDIKAPEGTPVYSPVSGIVTKSQYSSSYGNYVQLRLADSTYAEFGHLQFPSPLKVGDYVKAGDFVGYVGNTGDSTGPHLHYARKDSNKKTFKPPSHEVNQLVVDLNRECSKKG